MNESLKNPPPARSSNHSEYGPLLWWLLLDWILNVLGCKDKEPILAAITVYEKGSMNHGSTQ